MALVLSACAPRTGWERTDQRSCGREPPPRLCVLASPDAQLVVHAGGATIVPGECVVASRAVGGRVRVSVRDGLRGRVTRRWVPVRRGAATMISALNGEIVVRERRGCAETGAAPLG